jgi:ankyrin repeat protein
MRKNPSNNITELMMAASKGELEQAQSLLHAEMQTNERDAFGNTALVYAAAAGHLEVVRLLLGHGADASLQNQIGMTASMRAAANGYAEVVELLERSPLQVKQFPLGQREMADVQSGHTRLANSR